MVEQPPLHLNYKFVFETSLTIFEEMTKVFLKGLENGGVLDQLWLHFGCDLMVKVEVFNQQVEVEFEGMFNIGPYARVYFWLNVVGLITLFYFLDPHVQTI